MSRATKDRPIGDLLVCFWCPTVWATHFIVMYAAETLACTVAPEAQRTLSLIAAAATAIALASLIGFVIRQRIRTISAGRTESRLVGSSFLRDTSIVLALLA